MKIGVALSGCDIGGVSAYILLHRLREDGLDPGLISASGLAAVGALLFTYGFDVEDCRMHADTFIKTCGEEDLDSAIAQLSDTLHPRILAEIQGLSVSAINITDGKIITFTNDFCFATDTLRTYPIQDVYDMLSATVGGAQGLASYALAGDKLSDYSVRYGHPIYPLQMFGMKNIFSYSFMPLVPQSGYDILLGQKLEQRPVGAEVHTRLRFAPLSLESTAMQYEDIAISEFESCKNIIVSALV